MLGSISNTCCARFRHAAARGSVSTTICAIITKNRIRIAYSSTAEMLRDLHGVGAHAVAAHPQHRHLGDVHQKEAGAVETHKQVVDLDGIGRVIAKHLVQALLLVALLVEMRG